MTKEWWTPQELSGVEGMPGWPSAVRRMAQKDGWKQRKREQGKGYEYHITSFPAETAKALYQAEIESTDGGLAAKQYLNELAIANKRTTTQLSESTTSGLIAFNALPKQKQDQILAKVEVIKAHAQFVKPFSDAGALKAGNIEFIEKYNNRELTLPDHVYESVIKVSRPTLYRWKKLYETEGLASLGRKQSKKRNDCSISSQPELEQFCIVLLISNSHFRTQPSKVREYAMVQKNKLDNEWQIPSVSSFRRWINHWIENNQGKWKFSTDHTSYYGSERPLIHDHEPWVSKPNDMWELDSTPTDVMLNVDGKLVRYAIVACIDVFTKRVKMLLSPSSTADAIALLMRKVILDWGLLNDNGLIRTDNGADYVAKKTVAIFENLGAKQSRAEPFSGWQKPFIERFFSTFQGGIVEVLPTYIGHNVSDREKIEACKTFADRIGAGRQKHYQDALEMAMTPGEFQQFMDDWLEYYYNHRPHSGNDGVSPLQASIESGYKPRRVTNERSLDLLLNFVGEASVRRGGVQVNKLIYRAPELMEEFWMRKRVNVFLDPTDVAKAYLYQVGDWTNCVEAVNADLIGREVTPEQYSATRRETEKSLRNFKRDMKRYSEEFGIDSLAAEAIAQAKAKNNLSALTLSGEEHDNPALRALQDASETKDKTWSPAELDAIAERRRKRAEAGQRTAEQQSRMLKDEREIAWDMAEIIVNGGELDERQQKWFDEYLRTHTLTAPRIRKYIESGGKTRRVAR